MTGILKACLLLTFTCGTACAETLAINNLTYSATGVSFSFPTISNRTYSVLSGTFAPPNSWATLTNVSANGADAVIHDTWTQSARKFYRVFAEMPVRYLTVGHVGPTHARLAVGLDAPRDLRVIYSTNANLTAATVRGSFAVPPESDYTAPIDLTGLIPNTEYYFNLLVDRQAYYAPPYPSFRTAVPADSIGTVRIAFGSCFVASTAGGSGTIAWRAAEAANRIWQSIAAKNPDFFLHLGDTAYCDNLMASDLASYRVVHRHSLDHRLRHNEAYAYYRQHFPLYTTWDDHELNNDWPWSPLFSGPYPATLLGICKQAFREYHGRGNPDSPEPGELYYHFQFGDIGVFMTDTRSFRSCQQGEDSLLDIPSGSVSITFNGSVGTASGTGWNSNLGFTPGLVGRTLRLANGETRHIVVRNSGTQIVVSAPLPPGTFTFTVLGKTILGSTQKQHLKNWLMANKDRLRVKFIGTSTPINGLSEHITRKDAWGAGYQAELNEILDFAIANHIRNVVFLSGDQHWSGSFNRSRGGVNFFDFMSSSLSSSFYPIYSGTDETLLARVLWMLDGRMNKNRVENFGMITVHTHSSPAEPTTVKFELFDADGAPLNSTLLREGRAGLEVAPGP